MPHPDYLFRTVTHWRLRAEAIRALAEDAQDSKVRRMMLRLAADYGRLAGNADDRAAQGSSMFRIAQMPPESLPAVPAESGQK
jgi:hypothetical protein